MEDSPRPWEEDKIKLDFTVATDKNTLQINSSENIKSLEVSELKQRLECISDNTYDISNLERENYFLRVEFEDGKVVYKQLVLEEKE